MSPDKKNEFDKQLQAKFSGFNPEVPAGLWDKIAEQLDAQEHNEVADMTKKRRQLPTWWIAVAATLLIVCGVRYWYNRPITVMYLQGPVAQKAATKPVIAGVAKEAQDTAPASEPLDIERLKQVFARKDRKSNRNILLRPLGRDAEAQNGTQLTEGLGDDQQLAAGETTQPKPGTLEVMRAATIELPAVQLDSVEEMLASVPEIQPLVALEDEEETMLASAAQGKQIFGISNILNYVVGTVDQREEKLVTFSNDGEGSLKLDFNFSLAKNRKKKVK